MTDYTPTTERIREFYVRQRFQSEIYAGRPAPGIWERYAEFDRWLAAHDAEVRAGVVAEEPEWEYGIRADGDDEPYTDYSDDPDWLCDQITPEPGDAIIRRRKAGPWVPVKQEGADQ